MKYILICIAFTMFVYAQDRDSSFTQIDMNGQTLTAGYITGNAHYNINDILGLQQGVTLLDNQLHIRGARSSLTHFFLDGAFSNDIQTGKNRVYLIPSALDRISLYVDHTPYGLMASGGSAVMARIKKGGDRFKAHLNVQSDGFAPHGQPFLNSYSYGQRIITATLGGPLANGAIHYFIAAENHFKSDASIRYNSGFHFADLQASNRPAGETVSLDFPRGYTPFNQSNLYAINGALDFNFWGNSLRISGSGSMQRRQNVSEPWSMIFNDRIPYIDSRNILLSAHLKRQMGATASLSILAGYAHQFDETGDGYLGNDWMNWYDSSKTAAHGATFRNPWFPQSSLNINGLYFSAKGRPPSLYFKKQQNSLFAALDYRLQITHAHLLHAGLTVRSYSLRKFSIYPSALYLASDSALGAKYGLTTYGSIDNIPFDKWILNSRFEGYGYDFYGKETDQEKSYPYGYQSPGPIKPLTGSLSLDDAFTLNGINIQAGIRADYFYFANRILKDPANIFNPTHTGIRNDAWKNSRPVVDFNPFISLNGSISSRLRYSASYTAASQMPGMQKLYNSRFKVFSKIGFVWGGPVSVSQIQPLRSQSLNMGMMYRMIRYLSVRGNIFYTSYRNLPGITFKFGNTTSSSFPHYNYSDKASIYGFDLNMIFQPSANFSGQLYYSYQSGRGDYSEKVYSYGLRGDNTYNTQRPLDNLITHSGAMELTYAMPQKKWNGWFANSHINLLVHFNSGHPFTRQELPVIDNSFVYNTYDMTRFGVENMTETGEKKYIEPINASVTPWVINTDIMLDKSFAVTEKLNVTFFMRVTNLFNRKNVLNVFESTGRADDDGLLSNPDNVDRLKSKYGAEAVSLYKNIILRDGNAYRGILGKELYGRPRQIFAGIKLVY